MHFSPLSLTQEEKKRSSSRMSSFLPEDIIEENILTRLPVRSISRFRCVSKKIYHLFRNPNFIKNHLNHANLMNNFNILAANSDYNCILSTTSSPFISHALEINFPFMCRNCMPALLGSSNGLVLMDPLTSDGNMCIWNPATGEYKRLPDYLDPLDSVANGFGFDCKNDDYKVVRISCSDPNGQVLDAGVYSLASNSWKNLGIVPYDRFPRGTNNGVLLNGVIHWIATGIVSSVRVLVCFDVSEETFRDVPLPYNSSDEDEAPSISDLGVWEGKLCLFQKNHMEYPDICTHQNEHVDVWTMMDNKWSKHLKITARMADMYYGRPIQTLQNGEILIEGGLREEEGGIDLISYDSKLERVRDLKIHGFVGVSEVDTYIETLVPLNSGTYVNTKLILTDDGDLDLGNWGAEDMVERDGVDLSYVFCATEMKAENGSFRDQAHGGCISYNGILGKFQTK